MINEWDLASTNMGRLMQCEYEVAVLPIGATEPHNYHLPEGIDHIESEYVAGKCCELAWQESQNVLCLPGLPYGVDCNLMKYPLAIHVSQDTLNAMVKDIIIALSHYGIKKVVLLNAHGGNDFGAFIRQIQSDMDVYVFVCNWWTVGADKYQEIFDKPDDHAGELETSVALALCPELVELEKAGDGKVKPFAFEALRKGWVKTSRDFAKINDHCAAGEPQLATAKKGRAYLELVCSRVSKFIVELANASVDDHFPHMP